MEDARCRIHDVGWRIQVASYRLQEAGFRINKDLMGPQISQIVQMEKEGTEGMQRGGSEM
ncbi:MAG TPA: hypothetical protein ENH50_12145 [Nitrospirae bacterium]|nr:hypothetical protein [Nitrospirota bacterium]